MHHALSDRVLIGHFRYAVAQICESRSQLLDVAFRMHSSVALDGRFQLSVEHIRFVEDHCGLLADLRPAAS